MGLSIVNVLNVVITFWKENSAGRCSTIQIFSVILKGAMDHIVDLLPTKMLDPVTLRVFQ